MTGVFPINGLPPAMTIDVWVIRLDAAVERWACLDWLLSEEERTRAERYIFARDAKRFRLCRTTLRLLLARYLQTTPNQVVLTTDARRKPCLSQPSELSFNVAHSGDLAMIAFTTLGEVGIDVEAVRYDIASAEIACANFTPKEYALVAAKKTPKEQALSFLRLWTRKEAVLKAAGCGFSRGLDAVDVSNDPVVWLRGSALEGEGSCWTLQDLNPPDGFLGAVAGPPGHWSVRQWLCRAEDVHGKLMM